MRTPAGRQLLYPFLLALAGNAVGAPADASDTPPELRRLMSKDESMLDYAIADLNGDGLRDVVFIVEAKAPRQEAPDDQGPRTLKIAIRSPGGVLTVVKENKKAVYCRSCGGMLGDPFQPLDVSGKRFSIKHYGGSAWRWAVTTSFAYSRRDNTWQLVEVEHVSFHASDPDKMESKIHRPPRHFGKIDIADFDPEHYLGVGPK